MENIDTFNSFTAAFDDAVEGDNWSSLEQYLAEDVTYLNVGGTDPKSEGRASVIAFLKADVENTDRHFDKRVHVALTPPVMDGDSLTRQWRCTYSLAGTPDLVVEGEARYLFENGLINEIEEEVTTDTAQRLAEWMEKYGIKLHA